MRQAGVIAAAGLEAVVNNFVRLEEVITSDFGDALVAFTVTVALCVSCEMPVSYGRCLLYHAGMGVLARPYHGLSSCTVPDDRRGVYIYVYIFVALLRCWPVGFWKSTTVSSIVDAVILCCVTRQ